MTHADVLFTDDLILMRDREGLSLFVPGAKMPTPVGRFATAREAWLAVDERDLAALEAERAAAA